MRNNNFRVYIFPYDFFQLVKTRFDMTKVMAWER